jgi:hypothetical protein
LFVILIYALTFRTAGKPIGIALTFAGAIVAGIAIGIPIFKLRQHVGILWCRIATAALGLFGLAGIVAMSAAWIDPRFLGLRHQIAGWGLGHIVSRALLGDRTIVSILLLIDVALIGLAYFGATDIYPELNIGSARYIAALSRSRRGAFANLGRSKSAAVTVASVTAPNGFTGAAAMLWKDAISFRRATRGYTLFWLALLGAVAVGVGMGVYADRGADARATMFTFGFSFGFLILMLGTMASSVSLAGDLGKPIWWLSASSLRSRLYAWTVANSWRIALCALLLVGGWALSSRMPLIAFIGIPTALILTLFARAIGLALYSIFPSSLDQRGPAAVGRMLVMYAILVPPVGLGFAVGLVAGPIAGMFTAIAVAILELFGLIEFASARILKHGIAIAQAEST